MQKSTYIITLLLSTILCSFSSPASEMKEDEQKAVPYDLSKVKPILLDRLPYEKWPKNRETVYAPRLSGNQGFEDIVNMEDQRGKINTFHVKVASDKKPVDLTHYIVKLHSYYGPIEGKEIVGDGTATIITIEKGIIYLLTCAHNVVKHEDIDPFNPESTYSYFYAKNVSFSYQGTKYPCTQYYAHPQYSENNQNKDIAIVVSHMGFRFSKENIFRFNEFPEVIPTTSKEYKGYIIGFPGEKEKKNDLYGMAGYLHISGGFIEYDTIDTSKGQSGSPILVKINDAYKIIGLHTIMGITSNWGAPISQEIIEWERKCWFKTKEVYDRQAKIFDLGPDMEQILEEPGFDINMIGEYGMTPFLYAAKKGDLPALKLLQAKGANIHAIDEDGYCALDYHPEAEVSEWLVKVTKVNVSPKNREKEMTPFLLASQKGDISSLKYLKEKGANIHATDQYGYNALHCAIHYHGKLEVIEWLVNIANINVNAKSNREVTPFLLAVERGNIPVLRLLKEKGANINVVDQNGYSALHLAIERKAKFEVVEWLVKVARVNLNATLKDWWEYTPFLSAVEKGDFPALKLLKEKGANINATDQYGYNALHLAIDYHRKSGMIEWLVHVVRVNINDENGSYNTFLYAAKKGNLPALKFLKKKGMNVNTTDEYGQNALHLAAQFAKDSQVIDWLIDQVNISIESKRQDQKTAFLLASQKGNLAALKILKEKGANVNTTDQYGENALHVAINNSAKFEIIEWLVKMAKINVHVKSNREVTPFLLATERENIPLLKLLKEQNADINATDQDGKNALYWAIDDHAKFEVLEWLVKMAKVNLNAKIGYPKRTPFLLAALKRNLPAFKLLEEKRAHINAADQDDNNPLHWAIQNNAKFEMVEWLVNVAKVNVNAKDKREYTPFLYAAEQDNLSALKLLKEKGANINATDQDGKNALHLVIEKEAKFEVIEWLVNVAKVNVNTQDKKQQHTPFLCATYRGSLPALKLLKEKGANINATDQYGNNALHFAIQNIAKFEIFEWLLTVAKVNFNDKIDKEYLFLYAAKKGSLPVLTLLKEKGANVNVTDKFGRNALHWYLQCNIKFEVFKWLLNVAKVNINAKGGHRKRTPFLLAAFKRNLPALKLLKKKGANLHVTDQDGYNALWYARNLSFTLKREQIIHWLKSKCRLKES